MCGMYETREGQEYARYLRVVKCGMAQYYALIPSASSVPDELTPTRVVPEITRREGTVRYELCGLCFFSTKRHGTPSEDVYGATVGAHVGRRTWV